MPLQCSYVVRGFLIRHRAWPYALAFQTAWSGNNAADSIPECRLRNVEDHPAQPGEYFSRRRVRCGWGDHEFIGPFGEPCDTEVQTFKPATQIGWFQRNNHIDGILHQCPHPRKFEPGVALWHGSSPGYKYSSACEALTGEGENCGSKAMCVTLRRRAFRVSRERPQIDVNGHFTRPGNLRICMVGTTEIADPQAGCCIINGIGVPNMTQAECTAAGGTDWDPGPCFSQVANGP